MIFDIALLHCCQDAQSSRFSSEGDNINCGLLSCAKICAGDFRVGSIDFASYSPPQHGPITLSYHYPYFIVSAQANVQATIMPPSRGFREGSPTGGWSCHRRDGNTCCLSYPGARSVSWQNMIRLLRVRVSNGWSQEVKEKSGEEAGRVPESRQQAGLEPALSS